MGFLDIKDYRAYLVCYGLILIDMKGYEVTLIDLNGTHINEC